MHKNITLVISTCTLLMLSSLVSSVAANSLSQPGWWDGDCNVGNNPGSYKLGSSYSGVDACGPLPGTGLGRVVNFYPGAWRHREWHCTELVMRYMYLKFGIALYSANGFEVVGNYSGTTLSKISNNGSVLPSSGDVISIAPSSTYWTGHTAIITAVNVNATGSGTVTVVEQNASSTGSRTIPVANKILGGNVTGWLHNPQSDTTDIAWYESWNGGTVTISKNSTSGPPSGTTTFLTGYGKPDWAGTGDFNGDGKSDIAWYESGPGTIVIAYGNGAGGVQSYYTMLSGWGKPDWADVGDFNGDGRSDIAWYEGWNGGKVTIAYGSAGGPVAGYSTFQTGWSLPTWAGIGDFNGDGKKDIAWYRTSTSNVLVAYGNGAGGVASYYNMMSGWGTPAWAGVGDFNGDNRSDIAWYESWNNGTITIAQGSASGPMAGTTMFATGKSIPTWAGVGDFNGD